MSVSPDKCVEIVHKYLTCNCRFTWIALNLVYKIVRGVICANKLKFVIYGYNIYWDLPLQITQCWNHIWYNAILEAVSCLNHSYGSLLINNNLWSFNAFRFFYYICLFVTNSFIKRYASKIFAIFNKYLRRSL